MGYRIDRLAELQDSVARSAEYPLNLVRTEAFHHTLKSYTSQLGQDQVFHGTYRNIWVWDLVEIDGEPTFGPPTKVNDTAGDLQGHLNTMKNARWRFIFLQSRTSLDPIGASREQLTAILTHHQVMPSFLDIFLAFKGKERPLARAMFRHENYLDPDSANCWLPSMNRSGFQIQHAFNVLSVERTDSEIDRDKWPLRQTALYHSYDVESDKAVFIVLKGDNGMQRKIGEAVKNHRSLQPNSLDTKEASFIGTLKVQLIVLEWCAAHWSGYVDEFEERARVRSLEAKVAPVTQLTSPMSVEQRLARQGTLTTIGSRQNTLQGPVGHTNQASPDSRDTPNRIPERCPIPRTQSAPAAPTTALNSVEQMSSFGHPISEVLRLLPVPKRRRVPVEDIELCDTHDADQQSSSYDFDLNLSFEELQTLNLWGDAISRTLMAIEQNKGVLRAILEQYDQALKSPACAANINRTKCSGGITYFFRRINTIIAELDTQHARLVVLSRSLENDKSLFEATLNYQSYKVSEFFAHNAEMASQRMEDWTKRMHSIAANTERETISMHFITILTLIFLPGTFLAVRYGRQLFRHFVSMTGSLTESQTFFSSGVFQWDEEGRLGTEWVTRWNAMRLFFSICGPLMATVLGVWGLMYYFAWRRRKAARRKADKIQSAGSKVAGSQNAGNALGALAA